MVRGELAALLGDGVATSARGEDHGRRLERVLAAAGAPAVLRAIELCERALREEGDGAGLDGVAEGRGDRVPGAVADLEQAPARRACSRSATAPGTRSP